MGKSVKEILAARLPLLGLILIAPLLAALAGCASELALSNVVAPPEGYVPPFETMQVDASLMGMNLEPAPEMQEPYYRPKEEPARIPLPAWLLFGGAVAVVLEFAAERAGALKKETIDDKD